MFDADIAGVIFALIDMQPAHQVHIKIFYNFFVKIQQTFVVQHTYKGSRKQFSYGSEMVGLLWICRYFPSFSLGNIDVNTKLFGMNKQIGILYFFIILYLLSEFGFNFFLYRRYFFHLYN